jgi:uncharacterized membrane protein YsdA (DUF1294 family)
MTHRTRTSPGWRFALAGVALAAAVAVGLAVRLGVPWVAAALAGVNAATFVLYGMDKRRARRGALRVPERTLLLFSFAGGSPGALLGQRLFHHKTRKRAFQIAFWLLVAVQAAVIVYVVWYARPSGGA